MTDRIQYDGDTDHLDEFVVHDALVHIEAMSHHEYTLTIARPDGLILQLSVQDAKITHAEHENLLATTVSAPLLGCGHEWTTRDQRRHRCQTTTWQHPQNHICECGLRTPKEKK